MRYELIVFDWDGTVMDSAREIVTAMQRAIQDIGLPERSADRMRNLIGLGLNDVLRRLFPELDPNRVRNLLTAYRRRYTAPGGQSLPFAGAVAALESLHGAGYELAVATGKSRRGLDRNLAETGLGGLFRYSCCADEARPKPAPDILDALLLQSATSAQSALMVGDTEYDMAMAAAAGVPAVGVACGVHDGARLLAAGAQLVLPDIAALPAWLDRHSDRRANSGHRQSRPRQHSAQRNQRQTD